MTDTVLRDKLFNLLLGFNLNANRLIPQSIPDAQVGAPYNVQFDTLGAVDPVTYSLVSGSLPSGLTLSFSGLLSGTPTASGFFSFAIQSIDSDTIPEIVGGAYFFNVAQAVLDLAPLTLPDATVGVPYNQGITASGGTAPYTYTLSS